MSIRRHIGRRVVFLVPQLLAISVVTFILIRMLPGDPARLELGPMASNQAIQNLRRQLGLNKSIFSQYVLYLDNVIHGNLGRSWVNSSSVASDLANRVPATLELLTLGMLVTLLILLPLGIVTSVAGGGILTRALKRIMFIYGLLAGALPDFWLGLLLIFIFYSKLHWAPAPVGRLAITASPPAHITGAYTLDALITGNWTALGDALAHLALPVLTLAFVYGAAVFKMTRSSMGAALRSDFVRYVEGFGLPQWKVSLYAFRVAAPPVVTMTAVVSGYLFGGAVLIETVFNLNGVGQYAVQAVTSKDYAPIQAFVLVAAVFTMLVYLVLDILYAAIDPRVRTSRTSSLAGGAGR